MTICVEIKCNTLHERKSFERITPLNLTDISILQGPHEHGLFLPIRDFRKKALKLALLISPIA